MAYVYATLRKGVEILSIILQVKSDLLEARKAKNTVKANLLNTLYADMAMVGKNKGNRPAEQVTDDEATVVVKKFIKPLEETIVIMKERNADTTQMEQELAILNYYLPKQLTAAELAEIIEGILLGVEVKSKSTIGVVMKALNSDYKGQFDGKKANAIINELLK